MIIITVATDNTHQLKRYYNSCIKYGFDPYILGLGTKWNGGNMALGPGGGQKIILLKTFLENYTKKIKKQELMIFTDSYDVLCNEQIQNVLEKYNRIYNPKTVFGSEKFCWPDKSLKKYYPNSGVSNNFLNSGLFMGFTDNILEIIKDKILPHEDDQLYYTHKFLHDENIVLDYTQDLFYCLSGTSFEEFEISDGILQTVLKKTPSFIHANGGKNIKDMFNYEITPQLEPYTSYPDLSNKFVSTPKNKLIYIIIEEHDGKTINPDSIINLSIQKGWKIKIIYIYKSIELVPKFPFSITLFKWYPEVYSLTVIPMIEKQRKSDVDDYIFYISTNVNIKNNKTLQILLDENKNFISPMIRSQESLWSNFWGDVNSKGYYKRSSDYIDIINRTKKGLHKVPYIYYCFLLKGEFFCSENVSTQHYGTTNFDMELSHNLRNHKSGETQPYVLNAYEFGHFK